MTYIRRNPVVPDLSYMNLESRFPRSISTKASVKDNLKKKFKRNPRTVKKKSLNKTLKNVRKKLLPTKKPWFMKVNAPFEKETSPQIKLFKVDSFVSGDISPGLKDINGTNDLPYCVWDESPKRKKIEMKLKTDNYSNFCYDNSKMWKRIKRIAKDQKNFIPFPTGRTKRLQIVKPHLWRFKRKEPTLEELIKKDSYEKLLVNIQKDIQNPHDPFKIQNEKFDAYFKKN
ncbi:unnamed protein product [Moneuplotes crassus]|uniref:Uncharacterized protein n=1 Tax=Euplotes crassus TaxID=5936 RepID=A0AAD1XR83_EUPCR|nr:unnamed protein product [Moneuplotes crassus]